MCGGFSHVPDIEVEFRRAPGFLGGSVSLMYGAASHRVVLAIVILLVPGLLAPPPALSAS